MGVEGRPGEIERVAIFALLDLEGSLRARPLEHCGYGRRCSDPGVAVADGVRRRDGQGVARIWI